MTISPLDENGKPVDWWFAYKVPKLDGSGLGGAKAVGYEYVYYDPNIGNVVNSSNVLTDGRGALDLTLNSVFNNPAATTGWILYNDEMPASTKRTDNSLFGHTKGVIAFDTASKTAFWLLHSWPKYADPGVPGMPVPDYGQTFLCISLDMAAASNIATQMANHQEPQIYLPHIPTSLDKSDPLYRLTQPLSPNALGDSDVLDYQSRGGKAFKVIAKNRKWGSDFWNQLVAPKLNVVMDVETWIRGAIPSVYDQNGVLRVIDVKYIDLRPLGAPWVWSETKDHAKWGISKQSDWVCVGDINRMISQEKRGGGTIAFQEPKLWQALSKTDLIAPPPGMTEADARAMIKKTHGGAGS